MGTDSETRRRVHMSDTIDIENRPTVNTLDLPTIVEDEKFTPTYAHPHDAGMDLRAKGVHGVNSWMLPPNQTVMVPTGVRVDIPAGYVGLIHPRSGLAVEGITVINAPGTIDSGYRGEIKVLLINHNEIPAYIDGGERIAQLVIVPIVKANLIPVESFEEETLRGTGGFGSTGKL